MSVVVRKQRDAPFASIRNLVADFLRDYLSGYAACRTARRRHAKNCIAPVGRRVYTHETCNGEGGLRLKLVTIIATGPGRIRSERDDHKRRRSERHPVFHRCFAGGPNQATHAPSVRSLFDDTERRLLDDEGSTSE